jgi:type IV pilus assembly protein PilC
VVKIDSKSLAALCRRLAIAMEAGIDERKIWKREAERASGHLRAALQPVHDAVASGGSITDGIGATGQYFPGLFRELAVLGESTGKHATVFRRLADHYEHRVKLRREFLARITWPVIQLTAAIFIVGLLIWILGVIKESYGDPGFDVLGIGLVGNQGLAIYVGIVASCVAVGVAAFYLARSGVAWGRPLQSLAIRLPVIGRCLKTLALSRVAWTLGLSLEAGMDVRRALPFALRSTQLHHFARHEKSAAESVGRGDDVFTAIAKTGAFPNDFLDALQVGEQSGRIDESMLRLADLYQEQARAAAGALTTLTGFAVWAIVALMIVLMVINFFSGYANMLNNFTKRR